MSCRKRKKNTRLHRALPEYTPPISEWVAFRLSQAPITSVFLFVKSVHSKNTNQSGRPMWHHVAVRVEVLRQPMWLSTFASSTMDGSELQDPGSFPNMRRDSTPGTSTYQRLSDLVSMMSLSQSRSTAFILKGRSKANILGGRWALL